jgi:hypothetical protein
MTEPFRPFIPPEVELPELTARGIVVGALLGIVFGASSLYLVLKVGLTVSASIPVAVISIALFRLLSKVGVRDASILENNVVQTGGSAGESIAFGVGVTMPAIIIIGFDLKITRVMLVAVLGGLLGILMMIPLRRALIVQQHGRLKYPRGRPARRSSRPRRRTRSESWPRATRRRSKAGWPKRRSSRGGSAVADSVHRADRASVPDGPRGHPGAPGGSLDRRARVLLDVVVGQQVAEALEPLDLDGP